MEKKIELFQILRKESDGTIVGTLSDNGLDRDDEFVGEEAFDKILKTKNRVRLMANHDNNVFMRIGDWTNLHKEVVKENVALRGVPKFFLSNPNAVIIKNMLDEGAELDISIGAIVKNSEIVKVNGREVRKFTELELLEGSFVGIGSNRNSSGRKKALKIAKMFDESMEENQMTDEQIEKKVFDAEVLKVAELEKAKEELCTKNKELEENMATLKKEAEDAVAEQKEAEKEKETAEEATETAKEESKAVKVELEKLKKMTVKKAISESLSEDAKAQISKEVEAGALPIIRK